MTRYPDLEGKNVLVTGGAAGIGKAMVRAFAGQGATVHFCDVESRAGRLLEAELGRNARFSEVDLLRPEAVREWIAPIAPIGALVNNAAADPRIPFDRMTVEEWDVLFARNLRAYFLAAQAALPSMAEGSAVLNFSSITFHQTPREMTAYVSTKAGIQGFTRSLARELGDRSIRVNTLSPGWIMTERQRRQFVTPEVEETILTSQCIPRLIQPEEVADVALFLCSAASRAVTGQELLVDRGWSHS